jgi:8-oxo-dGTP pyrophosphatase MutT (NUDIX family)
MPISDQQDLFAKLSTALLSVPTQALEVPFQNLAAVGLLLRIQSGELELAFIRRAEDPRDGWSGQWAFPGGRTDPSDKDSLATATREVEEEIGLKLHPPFCVGQLQDVQARHRKGALPLFLRSFVFVIDQKQGQKQDATLNPSEVAELLWMPLHSLFDKTKHTQIILPQAAEGRDLHLPAIRFPKEPVLWGLTYMILTDFIQRLAKSKFQHGHLDLSLGVDFSFWKPYPEQ